MTREEVKVVFTGLAHDHLMTSPNAMHSCTQNYQMKRSSHHLDETRQYNSNRVHQHHHHNHHQHHHHQPLSGCTSDNLPRATRPLTKQLEANSNGASQTTQDANGTKRETDNPATALSTIAILRRHPMYDSLVLVKKYRPCLGGYTLEFPTENDNSNTGFVATSEEAKDKLTENGACRDESSCGRTKLVSLYLDGDDPIYQSQQDKLRQQSKSEQSEGSDSEVVYVPVNGLMDRLENYDRHGIAIDSRVYAFAMGLKTAERFLTSITVKEMQEAPPL